MKLIFRTDSSLQIGTGHVMRCLTLANELKEQGCEIGFICRNHPGNLNDLIRNKGFQVFELPQPTEAFEETNTESLPRAEYAKWLGVSWQRDAAETISLLGEQKPDWLIVDHYALDKSWETALRSKTEKIMVIDDLADREHDCDLLLDQNFYLEPHRRYDNLVPCTCNKLLGPEFALLRPEFEEARKKRKIRTGEVNRVLVSFGGTDQGNLTGKTLSALFALELPHLNIDVVIGKNNPHRMEIEKLAKINESFRLYVQIENMAELMEKADLAIGGAGSTSWERLSLGLPTLVVIQAENQKAIAENLEKAGAVTTIKERDLNSKKINSLIGGEWFKKFELPENLRITGQGAIKVAKKLNNIMYKKKIVFLVSDQTHPVMESLEKLKKWGCEEGFEVQILNKKNQLTSGKFLFLISCCEKVEKKYRDGFEKTFVIHASDLPKGRGWSPYIWDILEGKEELTLSLIEASDDIDCGDIWCQSKIALKGHELLDEILLRIFEAQEQIIKKLVINYDNCKGRKQDGEPGKYYRKRIPSDSILDINKSIDEQFNLLRVVDNKRFPAYFEKNGFKYIVRIDKYEEK